MKSVVVLPFDDAALAASYLVRNHFRFCCQPSGGGVRMEVPQIAVKRLYEYLREERENRLCVS